MPTPSSCGQLPAASPHLADPAACGAASGAAPSAVPSAVPNPGDVPLIRQAAAADANRLADWLDAGWPLPRLASRERRAMLHALLARPEVGPCILAESGSDRPTGPDGTVLGILTVQLIPRLDPPGLAAFATEWRCLRPAPESGAMLAFCADWLVDWCRAHGVRYLLLHPDVAAQAPSWTARMMPLGGGLPHLDLKPASKSLG